MFRRLCSCFGGNSNTSDEDFAIIDPAGTALDISHAHLEEIPAIVFAKERTLESLTLDANQLRDLPRQLFHVTGLRRLSLSDNDIRSVPIAVSALVYLEELNLSKNSITEIPESIKICRSLRFVDVSTNPLGKLPDGFTQLINLQELYLNDTVLEYLPANFGRLSRLRILELRENALKTLPKSMSRLLELTRLDIGQNDLIELPEVVATLVNLKELCVDAQAGCLPAFLCQLKGLFYLDCSNNEIEVCELEGCDSLRDLSLTSNLLTELPNSISSMVNLISLRLDSNQLLQLPDSIGCLTSLEELVVSNNRLSSVPPSIGFLRNLQTLILDSNQIVQLPASIGSCLRLRILSLCDNNLSELPVEIGRLSSLKVLSLPGNQIQYLPFSLLKLTQISALWLSSNQQKPVMKLQTDFLEGTDTKVLTCYLLPQQKDGRSGSGEAAVSDVQLDVDNGERDKWRVQGRRRQSGDKSSAITFADEKQVEDQETRKGLTRNPTPYPKELKAHARHAKNLLLKPKDAPYSLRKTSLTSAVAIDMPIYHQSTTRRQESVEDV